MAFRIATSPPWQLPLPPGGGTVTNYGPGTLYYRDELPVSSTTNDGSLAVDASLPFLNGSVFVVASALTSVDVKPLPSGGIVNQNAPTTNVQTGDYTLVASDAGLAVEINSGSNRTVTIPAESTVNYPVGTVIEIGRLGSGTVTIAGAGGVTLRSPGSLLSLRAQYSTLTIRKRATDEWWVAGDLA